VWSKTNRISPRLHTIISSSNLRVLVIFLLHHFNKLTLYLGLTNAFNAGKGPSLDTRPHTMPGNGDSFRRRAAPSALHAGVSCALVEPAGARHRAAPAPKAVSIARTPSTQVLPAEVALRKHSVSPCTHEDDLPAGDVRLPATSPSRRVPPLQHPQRHLDDCVKPWPPLREARGAVTVRSSLTSTSSRAALMGMHHSTLTIHIQSSPGGAFDKKVASIPAAHLVVTLRPGQFETLILSCATEDAKNIFCCCADQTARNKWVYVLRRVGGVTVRPLLTRALPSCASSPDAPSIPAPAAGIRHQPSMVHEHSRSQRVRAKFLDDAQRHMTPCLGQAATRHGEQIEHGKCDTQRVQPSYRAMISGASEDSILSRASTCASGQGTPVAVSGGRVTTATLPHKVVQNQESL